MTDDKLDALAHERFRIDFNKLFGGKATLKKSEPIFGKRWRAALEPGLSKAVRAEYAAGDEGARGLILIEAMLEAMAAPIRAARQAELARVNAENAQIRAKVAKMTAAVEQMRGEVDAIAGQRDALAKGLAPADDVSLRARLETLERAVEVACATATGVAQSGDLPFRALPALDLDRPMLAGSTDRLETLWSKIFATQRDAARVAAGAVMRSQRRAAKSAADEPSTDDAALQDAVDAAVAALGLDLSASQLEELTYVLGSAALDAAARTFGQIAGEGDASGGAAPGADELGAGVFADLSHAALSWARAHADELVDEINATTRDDVREAISEGLSDGSTHAELLALIAGLGALSEVRATLIATNEIVTANGAGVVMSLEKAVEAGLSLRKAWQTVTELGGPCLVCMANEEAGAIEVDAAFPSGDQAPPSHPNCRCLLTPLLRIGRGEAAPVARPTFH